MEMKVTELELPGVLVIEPQVFGDNRGFFLETYHIERYQQAGLTQPFVQDNHSRSQRGVLRGLHYQLNHPQGKLVMAAKGEIFDVAVDIRRGSPTYGRWVGAILSEENHKQIYVPEGFAHGFCVLSEVADVIYKCTNVYTPGDDYGIIWSDPEIAIDWPIDDPQLSEKDGKTPALAAAPPETLPQFPG